MPIQFSDKMVLIVHNYVVNRLVAIKGIMYSGTIQGSLERIFNGYCGHTQYNNVLEKAGAILYSIVYGHSFSDGNKRTGLLTTYLYLVYNGYYLNVPQDTTKFLERMADALDPKAPTEKNAINWVINNSKKSVGASILSIMLETICKYLGTTFLEYLTTNLLERGFLPMEKSKLIDKTLKTNSPIQCSTN